MAYKDIVLADSPYIYIPFTSNSVSTNLGSKTGMTATSGGITWGTSIIDGSTSAAAIFNGTSSYIQYTVGTDDLFNSAVWSMEAWIKRGSPTTWANIIHREEGTSKVLVRLDDPTAGTANKVTAVVANSAGSTTINGPAITDANWHHVVVTSDGTTVRLYVDNVLAGTGASRATAFTNSTWRIGAYGTGTNNENFAGTIDEVSLFKTTLSPTRVAAHYNAGMGNGGYAAQPMTATATTVDPVVTAVKPNVNYAAQAMTATATTVDPVVSAFVPHKIATNFDDKVNPFAVGSTSTGDFVYQTTGTGSDNDARLNNFSFYQGGQVLFHILSAPGSNVQAGGKFNAATSGTGRYARAFINNGYWVRLRHNGTNVQYRAWSETVPEPSTWLTGGIAVDGAPFDLSVSPQSNGYTTIDYFAASETTSVVMPNGLVTPSAITGTGTMVDPTVSLAKNVNYAASAAVATGLAVDSVFTNATNAQINTPSLNASALAVDPVVSVVKHLNLVVSAFTSNAEGPLGGFAMPTSFAAPALTASAMAPDASVKAELNSVVRASAANSMGVLMAPLEAQNATDDPYYNRLFKTTTADDFWYRLDEVAGSVAKDARGNTAKDADLVGAYSFGVYGPEGRRSMHFDNGYFVRRWPNDVISQAGKSGQSHYDDVDTSTWTFETVIRTTDKNGILAYGLDRANPVYELGYIPIFRNAISLKNGKVSIDWTNLYENNTPYALSGIKDIADGQWHHVVVSYNQGNEFDLGSGLRIVIDGKLDIRRRFSTATPGLWAAPDSYFGMPEAWRTEGILYPWQKNFVGDVMEVAFRVNHDITSDQTIDLYYDAMGIVPIRVQPATGVGVMPEAKAKGNRKRALVLYTKWNGAGLYNSALIGNERNAPSGLNMTVPDEFDHNIIVGKVYEPGQRPWEEIAGYRVEAVPIMREDSIWQGNTAGPYRDPVTDMPRLLNLQEDLDMDQYDVILFRNFPDEGADQEVFRARGYDNQDVDDFLNSVKQSVVDGKSLEITSPYIASRIGLIKGAQPIPILVDKERAGTWSETDKRAAAVNPWDHDKLGEGYMDVHANNWHRVVASVENLTDIPDVEHVVEAYITYNDGVNGQINNKWGWKFKKGALEIGEEFIDSIQLINRIGTYTQTNTSQEVMWDRYLWAITPDGLSVGTPLYRFGNKMWQGNVQVDNPYRDYIGGAVVQPGDTWDGQRVAGKVFINLGESPWSAFRTSEILARQIVPPNSELSNPNDWEDAEMRSWDYSVNRVAFAATNAQAGGSNKDNLLTTYVDKYGVVHVTSVTTAAGAGLVGIEISEKYPTEQVITPSWALRGLAWLGIKEEIPSGSVVIRPTTATATGSIPEAKVIAQKSVSVGAQSSSAIGVLVSPREVHDPNVTVIALPALSEGRMTGYGKTITVAPFEASGELVDNFDLISAAGEQVVVYLHYADAEVYLKEESK